MNWGSLTSFLALLTMLVIGFEIGKEVTVRKLRTLINDVAEALRKAAAQKEKDGEKNESGG